MPARRYRFRAVSPEQTDAGEVHELDDGERLIVAYRPRNTSTAELSELLKRLAPLAGSRQQVVVLPDDYRLEQLEFVEDPFSPAPAPAVP